MAEGGPTKTLWNTKLRKRGVDEEDYFKAEGGLNNPRRDIDAVLVFDIAPKEDVGSYASWERLETSHSYERRLRVLKCLHAKGLELTQSLSLDQTQWIIRISAPSELLEETAEKMGKKFKTKLKNSQEHTNQGLLSGYAEFRCEKKTEYEMYNTGRFKSIERQKIILYLVEKALGGDCEDYAETKKAENDGLFHLFPTHDPKDIADLNRLWVSAWCSSQPINSVRDYFGEDIGMYFAFLGHYTSCLVPLAMLGVFVKLSQIKFGRDTPLVAIYATAVVVWSTLFLETWKFLAFFL